MGARVRLLGFQILWLGLLWGALEALVGGFLHLILPPTWPGRIMLAISAGLLMFGQRITRQTWTPLAMAALAAPMKLWSGALYGLPYLHPMVFNPALAIAAQGIAMTLGILLLARAPRYTVARSAGVGVLAGALYLLVFILTVRTAGVPIYPVSPADGGPYPYWALSMTGIFQFAGAMIVPVLGAMGLGAVLAGHVPIRATYFYRPAYLLAGSLACLLIWFGALQL